MADSDMDKEMEEKLDNLFSPVNPSTSFIKDLQEKLTSSADITVEYPNYFVIIIVLGLGLGVGLILVFLLNHIFRRRTGRN